MNVKNNARYKASSEKIETAFLSLLNRYKYDDISIRQICEQANINRSTFYCHYDDINDLIIKIESKFSNSVASIFNFGQRQTHQAFIDMFTFIRKNKYFYRAFLDIPYETFAEKSIKIEVLKNIGSSANIDKADRMGVFYRASFFGAGVKEMCRIWLKYDCRETPEQMAEFLRDEYLNRKE